MSLPRPAIVACRATSFSKKELEAFKELNPYGLLLFNETCEGGPQAITHVIDQFKNAVGRDDIPVLIDNEGGLVYRFKEEFGHGWRHAPRASEFAKIAERNLDDAKRVTYLNAQLIAYDMRAVGVTVNCAPVLDVLSDDTFDAGSVPKESNLHATSSDMISRSFGHDVDTVITLGRAMADGLIDQGVVPIIKHIPGLGRAKADPHYSECRVDHSFDALAKQDFAPFKALNHYPASMTSHAIYTAIDHENSATLSNTVIDQVIRNHIGFKGVIIADTLEMNAVWPEGFDTTKRDRFGMCLPLPGTMGILSQKALDAGIDLLLHSACSDNFDFVVELLENAPPMSEKHYQWVHHHMSPKPIQAFDKKAAEEELTQILSSYQENSAKTA